MQIINKLNNINLNLNPFSCDRVQQNPTETLEHIGTEYMHHSINHQSFMRKEKYEKTVFSNDSSRCSSVFRTPVRTFFDVIHLGLFCFL